MAYLSSGFAWKLWAKHMKNYVAFPEAALEYAIPWEFPEIPLFSKKIPGELGKLHEISLIVIAIGDYYRFAFFGLVTKLWLKFQGLFLLVYGLLTLLFSCKTGLM